MLIKKYIKKQWLLFCIFSLLFLFAGCGVNEVPQKDNSSSSEENQIKFKTHKPLRKIANISAKLEISGIGIYDMTVNANDTVSANISSTVSIMPEGNYKFTITYYQGSITLADVMTNYDIKAGSNNIDFTSIAMNYDFDDDNDGTTNMDEIRAGSDPGNASPDGTIDTPTEAVTIVEGESVNFTGTGTDPDNNIPLTYLWDFGGGASNSTLEDPGDVNFNTTGEYAVTFTVTDSLGHTDQTPATVTVTVVDTTPPDTNITVEPADPSNSTSATFEFTSTELGSTFECQIDGAGYAGCTSPHAYNDLADGSHTFNVRTIDVAGNTDLSAAINIWVIDITPPDTNITVQPDNPTNSTSATFEFTSTELGSTFECQIDGTGYAGCTSPHTYNDLADGSHTFNVRTIDVAGNTDLSAAINIWVIDTMPPDTNITDKPTGPFYSTSAMFQFISTETGSTFECQIDGIGFTSCSSPKVYSMLTKAVHTFEVKAKDGLGNEDLFPAAYSWTIVNQTPVADAGPDQRAAAGTVVNLDGSGSIDDNDDELTYDWEITSKPAGSSVGSILDIVNSNFTPNRPGNYLFSLVVNDGTVDSTADTVTITASNLPDTGQGICYNNIGAEITCPYEGEYFFGQDAQYTTNTISFTDNYNGTVTDNVTGLMWQQEDDNAKRTWADAGIYCGSLSIGGHTDWRLPTKKELISIVIYGTYLPAIDVTFFPDTNSSNYWSATTYATNTNSAWYVNFNDGGVSGYGNKTYNRYVRCVRWDSESVI